MRHRQWAGPERVTPSPIDPAAPGGLAGQLPFVDAVVISHNHYDHLDEVSCILKWNVTGMYLDWVTK